MNTSQSTKNKGLNLSVTAKGQKGVNNVDFTPSNSTTTRSRSGKDSSFNKLPECSGGICTVNWKPNHNIA